MALIEFDAKTDTGKVRDHNEDAVLANAEKGLWVVADGMGGHACGEVASAIVLETVEAQFDQGASLTNAINVAHAAVNNAALQNTKAKGMGSTVVAMTIDANNYTITWVGDSRAYLLRNNELLRLSRDHSYLELLKDNGLTEEAARKHPKRNIITQGVGVGEINADTVNGEITAGDRYLLCSDGLSDELADEEIHQLLSSSNNAQTVTSALINHALDSGGRDNISVIIIDIEPTQRKNRPFFSSLLSKITNLSKIQPILLPIIGGVIAALVLAAILLAIRSR